MKRHPSFPRSKTKQGWSIVRDGFTLVELVAVIAIIAILAGLLLPVFGSAKRRTNSTRCISNLRQLGIAVRFYADENEGRLPMAQAFFRAQTHATAMLLIQQVLVSHLAAGRNIFKCPADKSGFFEREGSSYEWNASFNGRLLHRIGQDQSVKDATFLLRDREGWHSRGRKNVVFADGRAAPESL